MKVDRAADVLFACGAPESGKSKRLKDELARRRPQRLIVIDPDGEYEGFGHLHEPHELTQLYQATAYATFCTRFRPSHVRAEAERQFDVICQIVRWHADPQPSQARPPRVGPVCLVVDELADLVGSSFRETPDSWQWVIRRGRKYGVSVYAASQRPAQIDKTIFDLASCIRVGRLNNGSSIEVCAKAINVPPLELEQLVGYEFRERDKRTGELTGQARAATPAAAARRPGTRARTPAEDPDQARARGSRPSPSRRPRR